MSGKIRISSLNPEQLGIFKKKVIENDISVLDIPIEPAGEKKLYPLSSGQESLWFFCQMAEQSHIYNLFNAIEINQEIDDDILQKCIDTLVKRHASLRTRFVLSEGTPYQEIAEDQHISLQVVDLSQHHQDRKQCVLYQLLRAESGHSFDLRHDPLLKTVLYKLEDNQFVFLLNIHHIISDGWTIRIITKEVLDIYDAIISNKAIELPELSIRYVDFAVWQREWFQDQFMEKEKEYWKKYLETAPSFFSLPADLPRPANQTFAGDIYYFEVSDSLFRKLKGVCREYNVSLYAVMLAAFNVLLFKYTGMEDIVLGTPTAGRLTTATETIAGYFVNSLVIYNRLRGDMRFSELLNMIFSNALEAIKHQLLPFEKIVELINPKRDPSYSPLFQIFFIYQNMKDNAIDRERSWNVMEFSNGYSKYDITFELTEGTETIAANIEYNTDLYFTDTIMNLADHYLNILEVICGKHDMLISQIDCIGDEECKRALYDWNKTDLPIPLNDSIHGLFEKQVLATPNNCALVYSDKSYTYSEVEKYANRAAVYLKNNGVKQGSKIGIHLKQEPVLLFVLLGILKAGGTYIPLDPSYPLKRSQYIIENAKLDLLIIDEERNINQNDDVRVLNVMKDESIWEADDLEHKYENCFNTQQDAYIIYTSGSTGNPKGVCISHKNVINFLTSMKTTLDVKEEDVFFSITTYSFDISVLEIFLPLICGACIIQIEKEAAIDGKAIQNKMETHMPTFIQGTPAFFRMLLSSGWKGGMKTTVLCGGEELKWDLAQVLVRKCKHLWNMYGPTETTVWSLMDKVEPDDLEITIGRPIHNTTVYILDDNKRVVPVGVTGDLYIGGNGVAGGYYEDAEQTKERFIINPYGKEESDIVFFTGDRAKYLSNGKIIFCGRNDNQLKIRGYRIEPSEVEGHLNQHPYIENSVVIGMLDASGENSLTAFIKPNQQKSARIITISELRSFLKEKLPEYMIPTNVKNVQSFILTPNLKIDRKRVFEAPLIELVEHENYAKALSELEVTLVNIWKEVLRKDSIDIYDNFFDLGGYSILAVHIITRINKELKLTLPLKWVINYPTIAEFAANMEKNQEDIIHTDITDYEEITQDTVHLYDPFPLTEVQMAYWTGRNNSGALGKVATHLYSEIEIKNLDLCRFNKALNKVIERHDMLRAIITSDGMQQILEHVPTYTMKEHNLKERSKEKRDEGLISIKNQLSTEVLDAQSWPLFTIEASLLDDSITRLHISFDLLIGDAWSFQIILNEIANYYDNPEKELPQLPASFRDYVTTIQKLQNSESFQKDKQYWIDRLDRIPTGPQLPVAMDLHTTEKPIFKRWKYIIPEKQWKELTKKLKKLNITKTVFIAACFSSILSLWSEKSTFTLNLTLSNRLPIHPDIHSLVGDFTTISLLEVNSGEFDSFINMANRIQEQLLNDVEHRLYSGIRVTGKLIEKGIISEPFPVVFTSLLDQNNAVESDFERIFHTVNRIETMDNNITQTPQVWLDHQAMEQNGSLYINWDAVDAIFPEGMIDEMFDSYCCLLNRLAADDTACSQQRLFGSDHFNSIYHRNLKEVLAIHKSEYPVSDKMLQTGFIESLKDNGQAIAIETSTLQITYKQLDQSSNIIAQKLIELGMQKTQLVAVLMEKGWEQIVAVMGILKAGGAYIPIDCQLPAERVKKILEVGQVTYIITSGDETDLEIQQGKCVLPVTEDMLNRECECVHVEEDPERLAYVIFTSGSTGVPKGVMISHKSAVNTIEDINRRFAITTEDKIFGISSLSFDLSVYDIFGTFAAGGTLVLPDRGRLKDPSHWDVLIRKKKVTVWNSVPALMGMLIEYLQDKDRYETLRLVMMSGDWIPLYLPDKVRNLNDDIQVISLGGATEASIWSIVYSIGEIREEWSSIPYGVSMDNQVVYIMNENLEISPIGVSGEIYIGGIGVARGYLGDEEKTREKFIIHPRMGETLYRTGDYGRYMPDGKIEFLGRQDMQVKIGGYRIELGEIETALQDYEYIKDAVAVVDVENAKDQYIEAYVVLDRDLAARQDENLLLDPVMRMEFKLGEPGVRRDIEPDIYLVPQYEKRDDYYQRRSYRTFAGEEIPFKKLCQLLSCLSNIREQALPFAKYLYSSAGSVYPVQTYIYVKQGRVQGLEGGYYYYNPSKHSLSYLSSEQDAGQIHVSENKSIFAESAFSVFLISSLSAVEPLYGKEKGEIYSYIEAGIITEMLKTAGIKNHIGFCEIGLIDFEKIKHNFKLDESHLYLHMLAGGAITEEQMRLEAIVEGNSVNDGHKADVSNKESRHTIKRKINDYLSEKIPDYMIPRNIYIVDKLSLSPNGKIDRSALKNIEKGRKGGEIKTNQETRTPQNHVEEVLVDIWKQNLNLGSVSVDDNFFDIGGNSFAIIQVHKEITQQLGIDISIVDLFRHPTVSLLAEYINNGNNDNELVQGSVSRGERRLSRRRRQR